MLRDRLVCGIANPAVQKRLLTEPELTFTKAVTIAQAVELAEKGSKEIQSLIVKDPPKDIHKFSHVTNSKNFSNIKVLLPRTNHLLELVTAVVANIISQHVDSSLNYATSVISKATLQKYVKAE